MRNLHLQKEMCLQNKDSVSSHSCQRKVWLPNVNVKEQMWNTNVKYLRLSTEHFLGIGNLYRYTYVTILKVAGISKENEICLPNKESVSGHRCERTNMAAKCKSMNSIKTL